eukprot:TRINITY_DN2073_c1_g4_i1.p1 TRINITY_DN2073_c1_g4~~TRINITY_DN2073_c1_g4_i1.p1  ORF type:complete len:1062 (+),score=394.84 TRINITY_DN2073_c1_g4_i1:58-3186(+)
MTDFLKQLTEGYLWQNGSFKDQKPGSWDKSWYVIQENSLSSYKKKDAKHFKSGIDLADAVAVKSAPQFSTKKRFVFSLATKMKTHYFYTTDDLLRQNWISALENKILKQKEPQRPAPSAPAVVAAPTPANTTSTTATTASTTSSGPGVDRGVAGGDLNGGIPSTEANLPEGAAVLFQVIALFDCEPEEEGDLCFNAGDIIDILAMDEGWWTGALRGAIGILPSNYVEVIEPATLQRLMGVQADEQAADGVVPTEQTQEKPAETPASSGNATIETPAAGEEKERETKEAEGGDEKKEDVQEAGEEKKDEDQVVPLQEAEKSGVSTNLRDIQMEDNEAPRTEDFPGIDLNSELSPKVVAPVITPRADPMQVEEKPLVEEQPTPVPTQEQQIQDEEIVDHQPSPREIEENKPQEQINNEEREVEHKVQEEDKSEEEPQVSPQVVESHQEQPKQNEVEKDEEKHQESEVPPQPEESHVKQEEAQEKEEEPQPIAPETNSPAPEKEESEEKNEEHHQEQVPSTLEDVNQEEQHEAAHHQPPQVEREQEQEQEQEERPQEKVLLEDSHPSGTQDTLETAENPIKTDTVNKAEEDANKSASEEKSEEENSEEKSSEHEEEKQKEETGVEGTTTQPKQEETGQEQPQEQPKEAEGTSAPTPAPEEKFVEVPVLCHVEVLFDFQAENETELSVVKGTIIPVLEKDDTIGGWFKCHSDNRVGFVPASYVRTLTPEDFASRKAAAQRQAAAPASRQEELTQVSQATSSLRDKWKNLEQQQQQSQQQQIIRGNPANRNRIKELLEKSAADAKTESAASTSTSTGGGAARSGNNLRAQWENRIREAQMASTTPSKPARRTNAAFVGEEKPNAPSATTSTTSADQGAGSGPSKLSSDKKALVAGLFASKAPPPLAVTTPAAGAPKTAAPKSGGFKKPYGPLPPPGPPMPSGPLPPPGPPVQAEAAAPPLTEEESLKMAEQELMAAQQRVAELRKKSGLSEETTNTPAPAATPSSPSLDASGKKSKKTKKEKEKEKEDKDKKEEKKKKGFFRLSRRF